MQDDSTLPDEVRVVENVFIPTRSGIHLAARLWIPKEAEERPLPAVMEYIPYRKRDVTRGRDTTNHAYIAAHGYVCLRVDMRGSGDSDGVLIDEYTREEQEDAEDVIAWLREQPWCDGKVGMMGISWGGFNSLQVAARRPPGLEAIVSVCSSDDLYADNMHYMGGCLLGDNLSEATVMFAFNSLPPDPAIVGERWRAMWRERLEGSGLWLIPWLTHQRRDEYWRGSSVCEDYSAVACPVFAVGGWADGFTNTIFRLMERLECPCKGLIGPWGHRYPHHGVPGPAIGFLQEVLRWWDYWLKGRENGMMEEPLLRAWMQDSVSPETSYEERPGRWVAEASWPSDNIVQQSYALTRFGLVAQSNETAPPSGADRDADRETELTVQSPVTLGMFAGKWCSYAATPDLPGDQREEDGGALVFESPPLEAAIDSLGRPVIELEVAADKPQGMVAVRLSDVAPDGKTTRVTYGLLNLAHRNGDARPEPLVPHRRYRVAITLNGMAQRFEAGHRLRVSISTSYWPLAWLPPEPVTLSVFPAGCRFVLPLRKGAGEDEKLHPFAEPEAAPPLETRLLQPGEHNWRLIRDLASEESTLEVVNDQGCFRIEETGTEIRRGTWEWYSVKSGDFASARGETQTRRVLKRDDWDVSIDTRTVLTCTPSAFHVHAQIDAYEKDERVYSDNWTEVIPRDCL